MAAAILGTLATAGDRPRAAGASTAAQGAGAGSEDAGEGNAPAVAAAASPLGLLLPDSELVWGPSLYGVDAESLARQAGGYLASYSETVDGEAMSGPAILRRVAEEYSVGPRALLALVEAASGWVQDPAPAVGRFPVGGHARAQERDFPLLAPFQDVRVDGET
ncbi:MAG: hypothetical protein ACE5EL_03350, partial [Anaerolineae bacterium]